jgi:two-component system response regulator FixJ
MAGSRIALIDDHAAVRQAIGDLLEVYGYDVARYESAEAFLADPGRRSIGCVISDVRMPGMDGVALVHALAASSGGAPVPTILISGQADIPMAVAALKAGAADFIEKPVDDVRLVAAINRALVRATPTPDQTLAEVTARFERLTPREITVFDMIADGHTSQSIASNLNISARTVEGYRAQLMEKLQVTSIAAIVRLAIRLGRISP